MPRLLLGAFLVFFSLLAHGQSVSYSRDIQPIFTRHCVACHACYDSPCQLNLGSAEGAARGASKKLVYDGTRSKAEQTTRLFIDAHNEEGWRRKSFYSVLQGQAQGQAALMSRMLELGRHTQLAPNSKLPKNLDIGIDRTNQCPLPSEFDAYASKQPMLGMPFAVTGLSEQDYQTVQLWLDQGAALDSQPPSVSAEEARQIADWENFLNAPGARQALLSRWLYEHLFLAHLHFEGTDAGHFFQLVRSRKPSGQPVDIIATRRVNDDPGTTSYYRLIPIQGVIVHKTHITYPLSAGKLERIKSLFFATDWQVDSLPGFGVQRRSNPFETFAAIPAEARYRFMLDNAEYFVRTFIRGPVCRGQIATDVIRDNFWVIFQDPKHDLYITDPQYRGETTALLSMPGQLDEIGDLLGLWRSYRDKRNAYEKLRTEAYAEATPPDWRHIWSGNDNALLSIFRQHDSASVRKGLIGEIPQTLWWMDYPLLERTYYQLVVNFDVFGNVSHQAQTRLYFDLIRNGAEQNFLRLMPPKARAPLFSDWYQYSGKFKAWMDYYPLDKKTPSGLQLQKERPKEQFANMLLQGFARINARPDPINRCKDGHCYRNGLPADLRLAEQLLSRLAARPAAQLPVINHLPEASLIRVEGMGGRREVYSLLRNRAHSNVAFMLGEGLRYQPSLDTLTLYPEVLTSYPNFIFSMSAAQVQFFVAAMERAKDAESFERLVERWGVRRSHPQFWQYFHDLSEHIREHDPLEAGVLDMNRYQNL